MTGEYSIVPYTSDYRDQLLELGRLVWTADPVVNSSYLRWKHEQNPYLEGPVFYLAMHRGRIIGMRGLIGACWESDGAVYRIPLFGDSATCPAHRGRGVMNLITHRSVQEVGRRRYPYVFSLSSGPATRKAFLNAGALRIELPATLVADRKRSGQGVSRGCDPYAVSNALEIEPDIWLEHEPRAAAMSGLVKRSAGDGRIRHIRDESYFSWRYSNPLARYWFLYLIEGRELLGYMVIQRSIKDTRNACNIVDCETLESNVFPRLLDAALNLDIAVTIRMCPNDADQAGELRRRRFRENRAAYRYSILVGRGGMTGGDWRLGTTDLGNPADWDVRMIDSDSY